VPSPSPSICLSACKCLNRACSAGFSLSDGWLTLAALSGSSVPESVSQALYEIIYIDVEAHDIITPPLLTL